MDRKEAGYRGDQGGIYTLFLPDHRCWLRTCSHVSLAKWTAGFAEGDVQRLLLWNDRDVTHE